MFTFTFTFTITLRRFTTFSINICLISCEEEEEEEKKCTTLYYKHLFVFLHFLVLYLLVLLFSFFLLYAILKIHEYQHEKAFEPITQNPNSNFSENIYIYMVHSDIVSNLQFTIASFNHTERDTVFFYIHS